MVKITSNHVDDNVSDWLCDRIYEYFDNFQEKLPDGLAPARAVRFNVEMKPDAISSSRVSFPLSKIQQEALNNFVADNLKKAGSKCQICHGFPIYLASPKKTTSREKLQLDELSIIAM